MQSGKPRELYDVKTNTIYFGEGDVLQYFAMRSVAGEMRNQTEFEMTLSTGIGINMGTVELFSGITSSRFPVVKRKPQTNNSKRSFVGIIINEIQRNCLSQVPTEIGFNEITSQLGNLQNRLYVFLEIMSIDS